MAAKQILKNLPLIDSQNVLLPPFHIKLGIMKQFVKALNKSGPYFHYLVHKFPMSSKSKAREGVCDSLQICKLKMMILEILRQT